MTVLLTSCVASPGDPRDRTYPLPPGAYAGLSAFGASAHGFGGSGPHAPTLHAERSPHGEPHVCLPSEHGPSGHVLREQVSGCGVSHEPTRFVVVLVVLKYFFNL